MTHRTTMLDFIGTWDRANGSARVKEALTVLRRRTLTPARPSIHVEPTGDRMRAFSRTPEYHELAHANVETGHIAHDTAVRDQDQRRSVAVLGDRLLDFLDLPASKLRVTERAQERVPRFDPSESEPGRIQATAAGTRQDRADRDPVLAKRLADLSRLMPPAVVQVALRRAVVEPGVGRIEPARRKAVAQHHDSARCPQGFPDRIRGGLRLHGERHGDASKRERSEKAAAIGGLHRLAPSSACPLDHRR